MYSMSMIEYTEILCTTLSSRYNCISTVQVQVVITTLLLYIIPQLINNNVCSYKYCTVDDAGSASSTVHVVKMISKEL